MKSTNTFLLILLISSRGVSGSFVICPFCDPNYVSYPNLEEPCRGYDLPMGNPSPERGKTDPGIRNQIFNPMYQNDDGYYAMQGSFITANIMIKCDATWTAEVYDSFNDYVKGKMATSSSGYGIQVSPTVDFSTEAIGFDASGTIPSIFSRSSGTGDDVESSLKFFTKERGSIAVSEAVCLTQRVDIHEYSKMDFTVPFQQNVLYLYRATLADNQTRLNEYKKFVNEFGTHYSTSTEMGTKINIERRYSAKERSNSSVDEMKECNTLVGAQIFGFQTEMDTYNCTNENLRNMGSESETLERTVISTFGSFVAESLAEWTKQVVGLVQINEFQPHIIKRNHQPIQSLFNSRNFAHLKLNNESIDASVIIPWFTDYTNRYCEIFDIDCSISGCGIDDDCPVDQFCKDNPDKKVGPDGKRFTCLYKEVDIVLPIGRRYIGEINVAEEPQGKGTIFKDQTEEWLEYEGSFKKGLKDGFGTFYYKDGAIEYQGDFKNDVIHGYGVHFYQNGNMMYDGFWQEGQFITGKRFNLQGKVMVDYEQEIKEEPKQIVNVQPSIFTLFT